MERNTFQDGRRFVVFKAHVVKLDPPAISPIDPCRPFILGYHVSDLANTIETGESLVIWVPMLAISMSGAATRPVKIMYMKVAQRHLPVEQ